MLLRKLTSMLTALGTLAVIGACGWWFYFYRLVTQQLHGGIDQYFTCLYAKDGGCGLISGVAQLTKTTPYDPLLLWVGGGLLGAGILFRILLK